MVHLVDIGLDLPEAAAVEALQADDVAAAAAAAGCRTGTSTPAAWSGCGPAPTQYPGAAVLSVAGANCGLVGMVRYAGGAGGRRPRGPPRGGRARAGAGLGDRVRRRRPAPRGALAACLADGVPVVVDADALAPVTGPLGVPAVLTPHAGELARCSAWTAADVEAAQLGPRRGRPPSGSTPSCCSRAGTPWSRSPAGRVRVNTTGAPWLATAGAGDVLAGLVGALLAAGLAPFDAASVGAWLHGAAATVASGGGTAGGRRRGRGRCPRCRRRSRRR